MLTPERPLLPSPVLQTQPSSCLSPKRVTVVVQKKNLVSEVVGEPVETEPNFCLSHLCRTKSCLTCQPGTCCRCISQRADTYRGRLLCGSWLSFISFPSVVVVENICISTSLGRDMGRVTWMWWGCPWDGQQGWMSVWCPPSPGVTSCLGDLRMHMTAHKLLISHLWFEWVYWVCVARF